MLLNELFDQSNNPGLTKGQQGVAEGSINEGVNDPHIFKAIAMIGPMGAGKSTIARQLVGGSGLRSLNLDNFNELLIRQGKVVGGNLTPDQLERNWQLAQKQKGNWVSERLGLLIDGSGRNVEGLVKPLNELEQLGYDTMIILVNVSLETSIQRQQSRAAQQAAQFGQGRNVPLDLAKSSYQKIQQNIPKLKQLYGNRLLIIDNEGAIDLSQEKTIVNRFMAAPPSKPAAVAWIKAHSQSQGQKIDKQLAHQQRQQMSAQRAQTQQGVTEVTGDVKFDKMLKGITAKKAVAKQQKADTQQQARDAFGGMFGGGNPADKLGVGKKKNNHAMDEERGVAEDLRKWFKEKWVRFGPDGKIRGDCARGSDSEGKPKCLPQSKAHALGKKGRASAASRKRRKDPNPDRSGKAINVKTKK